MIPQDEETRDDMRETVQGHVETVLDCRCRTVSETAKEWPTDPPSTKDADVLASWYYITGYANGLRVTVPDLIMDLCVSTGTEVA